MEILPPKQLIWEIFWKAEVDLRFRRQLSLPNFFFQGTGHASPRMAQSPPVHLSPDCSAPSGHQTDEGEWMFSSTCGFTLAKAVVVPQTTLALPPSEDKQGAKFLCPVWALKIYGEHSSKLWRPLEKFFSKVGENYVMFYIVRAIVMIVKSIPQSLIFSTLNSIWHINWLRAITVFAQVML